LWWSVKLPAQQILKIKQAILNDDDNCKLIKDYEMKIKLTLEFVDKYPQFYSKSDISLISIKLGLKRMNSFLERNLQLYAQLKFLEQNSFEFSKFEDFKIEELVPAANDIVATKSFGATSLLTGSVSQVKNHMKPSSLNILYLTNYPLIDNWFKYSLILNNIYRTQQIETTLQRMQIKQLIIFLNNRSEFVQNFILNLTSTRFVRNNQNILVDYFENIHFNNLKIAKAVGDKRITPYLLELNGLPGVGKTIFVDTLEQFVKELFPFIDEDDLTYTRVNDKFWNGYNQQPIVLFDDPNQNDNLLYDLDNEIIQLGSGRFIYPPMAFAKNTKFSSLFICFTTNKKILQTTRANKGAIARRIDTQQISVKAELGEVVNDDSGKHWRYYEHIEVSPFNLVFGRNKTFLDVFGNLCDYFSNSANALCKKKHYADLLSTQQILKPSLDDLLFNYSDYFLIQLERYRRDYTIENFKQTFVYNKSISNMIDGIDGCNKVNVRVKSTSHAYDLPLSGKFSTDNFIIFTNTILNFHDKTYKCEVLCEELNSRKRSTIVFLNVMREDCGVIVPKNCKFTYGLQECNHFEWLTDLSVKFVSNRVFRDECVGKY